MSDANTVQQLLRDLARRLDAAGVPSPRVDAEELVLAAFGWTRTRLRTRALEAPPPGALARLDALVARREAREPLQHLLGETEWGGLVLRVTPAALVPRPETEVLLELALAALRDRPAPRVLDVGTGTGALALALKAARPDASVAATDLDPAALALARENAVRLGLDVAFLEGDLHAGLAGPFDLIVSNPPYLPEADAAEASPEVRRDPALALYAGPDGLAVARRLVAVAPGLLAPGGALALELDPRNVRVLAGELAGWTVDVVPDLAGRERFLVGRIAG